MNYKYKFDRIFFLSGLDYPLWSNEQILDFLYKNPNKDLIKGMDLTHCLYPPKMQTRVRLFHFRDINVKSSKIRRLIYGVIREGLRFIHINKKNYIDIDGRQINIYCGSSWWCLSYDCLQFVYNTYKNEKSYESYFKTALSPDEMLI